MSARALRLDDADLFGNIAAEDESADVFDSYFFERPELTHFQDPNAKVLIALAYKGEGKSALLRGTRHRLPTTGAEATLAFGTTGPELAPDLPASADFDAWVRGWKESILRAVACEVGAQVGLGWSGDALALREEADRKGFMRRSIFGALLSRLRLTTEWATVSIDRPGVKDPESVLKRWAERGTPIWVFIDDIDQNFENNEQTRRKLAALFVATRQSANAIPELRFRLAIRPNVWTILEQTFESMSHVRQYAVQLSWTEDMMRGLLARRIEGYLHRRAMQDWLRRLPAQPRERDIALIELGFEGAMRWGKGGGTRPPHVVLYTLSMHRPRWMIELSRHAARRARNRGGERVALADIDAEIQDFGQRRIQDFKAEFRSQCPQIEELLVAFSQQCERLTTAELIQIVNNRILAHLSPQIAGTLGKPSALEVAHFLFQVGFFYGRRDRADGSYEHITFSEQPTLLDARTNVDDGLCWEIHPAFRRALSLKNFRQ